MPPDARVIVPKAVVPVPSLGVVVLPGQPDVEPADVVQRDVAVERLAVGPPDGGLAAVGHRLRAPELVAVHVVEAAKSTQRDAIRTIFPSNPKQVTKETHNDHCTCKKVIPR